MPAFLTLALLRKVAPYLAILALAAAGFLWVHGMQASIRDLRAKDASLSAALASETQARVHDVAGLTTLSQGLVAASSAKAVDQKALRETINVQHPQPASPGLAALLSRLRDADADDGPKRATAGNGGAAGASAAGSH